MSESLCESVSLKVVKIASHLKSGDPNIVFYVEDFVLSDLE